MRKSFIKIIIIVYIHIVKFIFSKGVFFSGPGLFAFCNPFTRNRKPVYQKKQLPALSNRFICLFAFCDLYFAEYRLGKQKGRIGGGEMTKHELNFPPLGKKGGSSPSKSCFGFFDRSADGKAAGFLKALEFSPQG